MSGVDIRKRMNLNSTFIRFKFVENNDIINEKNLIVFGRGSGHGVGMSQWGARYMASKGQKAETILKHFYMGVSIKPFNKSFL